MSRQEVESNPELQRQLRSQAQRAARGQLRDAVDAAVAAGLDLAAILRCTGAHYQQGRDEAWRVMTGRRG